MANENITSSNQTIPPHEHPCVPPHEHHHCIVHPFKRISWTAIFAGAIVGVGLGFLLNLFGLAIGLSAFTLNEEGGTVLAIGGLIGILIGVIASTVVAGYTAGYLGRLYCPKRNLGILYGFMTWSIALFLSAILTGHVGQHMGAYANVVSSSMAAAPQQSDQTTPQANVQTPPETASTGLNVNVTPRNLAWTAFIIFALFFIGALSACVGACWGMACRKED
ncbi:Uncharacterised protein [Legionella lansingensis]|uniref:Transmembrane protein n=1 Tax=Legionella lansingensis TaxID=45067 RepID=A0A0W0VIL4_9GAMM|nr:hypothetical protein [Legionella lansingensis]KTD19953.1 hypothetical protein Llan_2048 [Legionella lansingensis]SNV48559.1 Uncharacterised protein [Legionella lansingensis]